MMSLLSVVVLAATVSMEHAGDWPQFRGPSGPGVGSDASFPLEWSKDEHLAWKTEIPGVGWSQPITFGPLVFVISSVSDKVIIVDEAGNAMVLQAGPNFRILGQSGLEDRFWAPPATAKGVLLLRGLESLYRIRN